MWSLWHIILLRLLSSCVDTAFYPVILTVTPLCYLWSEWMLICLFSFWCWTSLPVRAAVLCWSAWSQGDTEREAFHIPPLIITAIPICILRVSPRYHPSAEDRCMLTRELHSLTCRLLNLPVHKGTVTMKTDGKNTLQEIPGVYWFTGKSRDG